MARNSTTHEPHPDAVRRAFEPRAGRPLSDEDVREIRVNLTGFFDVLAGWQRASGGVDDSDTGACSGKTG